MTVTSTTRRNDYTAAASQTTFPYTFKIFSDDQLLVYVDNVLKDEWYLSEDIRDRFHAEDFEQLEPGEFYVMGDNRPVSKDSRAFRAVQDDEIIGRAVLRFWPPSRISILK